jgi:hypothetical protein
MTSPVLAALARARFRAAPMFARALQEISKLHQSLGLADPTLGGAAAAAISGVAGISPPRSWPNEHKQRFKSLPYDLQDFVAAHEARRDKALRRAQNEAAIAKQKLEAREPPLTATTKGSKTDDRKADENDPHTTA